MRALINVVLVACFALQGISGGLQLNPVKSRQNSQSQILESNEKFKSVPLFSDTAKTQQTDSKEPTTTTINVKANPQLIIPGVPISVEWNVQGWTNAQKKGNLKAEMHFPKGVKSNETSALLSTTSDGTTMDLPISDAEGSTSFSVDSTADPYFLIDVGLNSGDTSLATNSILMTKPSLEAVKEKKII